MNVDKDLYYIEHQGLRMDGLVLLGTCRIVLVSLVEALFSHWIRPGSTGSAQILTEDSSGLGPESVGVSYSAGAD
jgi:hypothetical protein